MRIKDWLPQMLKVWASQKKRAMTGLRRLSGGAVHEDGWAAVSFSAAGTEGGITGGAGVHAQHFKEVYTGDAYRIWRIYNDSPIEVRDILDAHFLQPGLVTDKARKLDISLASYWKQLDCAYYFLAGHMAGQAMKAVVRDELVV